MPADTPREHDKPADDEPADGQGTATPDEDGPHDVPDEKVIEKTLPTQPGKGDRNRPG